VAADAVAALLTLLAACVAGAAGTGAGAASFAGAGAGGSAAASFADGAAGAAGDAVIMEAVELSAVSAWFCCFSAVDGTPLAACAAPMPATTAAGSGAAADITAAGTDAVGFSASALSPILFTLVVMQVNPLSASLGRASLGESVCGRALPARLIVVQQQRCPQRQRLLARQTTFVFYLRLSLSETSTPAKPKIHELLGSGVFRIHAALNGAREEVIMAAVTCEASGCEMTHTCRPQRGAKHTTLYLRS